LIGAAAVGAAAAGTLVVAAAAVGAAAATGAPAVGAVAAPLASEQPILIHAAFSRVDYRTNAVTFANVTVSQGDTRVSADRAHVEGVGFTESRWTFEGDVRFSLEPRGMLRADQAVVRFHGGRISQATAAGHPAYFEQQRADSREPARGRAEEIVYDPANDSVRLSGDAELSDGRGAEISGPVLVYDIRDERLVAVSSGSRRGVHVTVTPQPGPNRREPPAGVGPGR